MITEYGRAKTLNKFKMFALFDSTRFDYFLWMDADITVFGDPMPYLHMHKYPGEIECVPDLYSHMARFPAVNESAPYWSSLPPFELMGRGKVAPHGLCNTGILYLDSLSLAAFNAALGLVLTDSYLIIHGRDRFVDSLAFNAAWNTGQLEVTILPHALNYMALLEDELGEVGLQQGGVAFAHFVSDTDLRC
ncbi:hypothetical protein B484DRAFT_417703, partial [Ochromonadaceae sp. CCMP2298]